MALNDINIGSSSGQAKPITFKIANNKINFVDKPAPKMSEPDSSNI